MPKSNTPAFYAVNRGRSTGVFSTWDECKLQVSGFHGARYKKFTNAADAENFAAGSTVTSPVKASVTSPIAAKIGNTSATMTSPGDKGKKRARSPDIEDEAGWDVVYSDGACKGNGQPGSVAGIGVWWGKDDPRNIAERCPGNQTNNRAELIAILRILETAPIRKTPLLIKSDSDYSINCFKHWLPKWLSNNFRSSTGAPVKNAPLIRCLSAHLDLRARSGQQVHLQYVKGHSGELGNDGADALANCGARMPSVAERDWAALEKDVRVKVSATADKEGEGQVVPLEIWADGKEPEGSPPKTRRVEGRMAGGVKLDPVRFAAFKPPDPVVPVPPPAKVVQKVDPPIAVPSRVVIVEETDIPDPVVGVPPPPKVERKVDPPIAEPSRVVGVEEIDLDMYADCLLPEEDLQNEIDD